MKLRLVVVLPAFLLLLGIQTSHATTTSFGGARPFNLFVPSTYNSNTPAALIIALHGFNQDGDKFEKYLNLTPIAEADDILYVHPDGTADTHGIRFWNATPECCDFQSPKVDDDAYIMSIIDQVSAQYSVDPNRIYVIGHSNGGFMANRLACDHADRIAGVVNIAGGTFTTGARCKPAAPISVLEIWGSKDVTYKGNHILGKPIAGAEKIFTAWGKINQCVGSAQHIPEKLDLDRKISGAETTETQFLECPSGTAIEFWRISGASHVPNLSKNFTKDVVNFLLAHPKVSPSISNP
jgi:polyhydroxybutyrate depolymerase